MPQFVSFGPWVHMSGMSRTCALPRARVVGGSTPRSTRPTWVVRLEDGALADAAGQPVPFYSKRAFGSFEKAEAEAVARLADRRHAFAEPR
jgi:hypothetical protein